MKGSEFGRPQGQQSRGRAYRWGVLAALTCPCHLLLLTAVLAGTSAGAMIAAHWALAAVTLTALFGLSLTQAWRAFNRVRSS
jgi:mercuric ion transport protein